MGNRKALKQQNNSEGKAIDVHFDDSFNDPTQYPPWYVQLLSSSEAKRRVVAQNAMNYLIKNNPTMASFLRDNKCELVGIQPRVEYARVEGDNEDLSVTWIHAFSVPTLQFWCPKLKCGIFVNVNLRHNDTILNDLNSEHIELEGWTG